MKYYLLALLFLIMGAGARTMFEIAHQAMGREHDFAPAYDTILLMTLALWFVVMMIVDVILLRHKELKNRNIFIALLSVGVFVPILFKLFN